METGKNGVSRRSFMKRSLVTGAAVSGLSIIGSPVALGQAKKVFKIGLIGCGGRGRGAVLNSIEAAEFLSENGVSVEVKVTALADIYKENLDAARKRLKDKGFDVPDAGCFLGFDGYKKVIDSGVDVVLLATPPVFRPVHLETAIKAGKHVFMEKPVAVDPVGAQRIIAAGELAGTKGLAITAGTQRRHQNIYLEGFKYFQDGAIGDILGGAVYWCGGSSWEYARKPGWSNADYMIKNWANFVEMSGDHIIEQHVHNIDAMAWFLGGPPSVAIGFGARMRRNTGNQFDFFSVDFQFKKNRVHVHSMCRQVDGCYNRISEELIGQKGTMRSGRIKLFSKKRLARLEMDVHRNPYVQEHVDLLEGVIKGKLFNEAKTVAESTMTGMMGRISAYTGKPVRWSDVASPEGRLGKLQLSPTAEDFEKGDVKVPEEKPPILGREA